MMSRPFFSFCVAALVFFLAGNAFAAPSSARSKAAITRVTPSLETDLADKGLSLGSPVFIQIIKQSSELRLFVGGENGEYSLFRTYAICAWSGDLGPKRQEGDGQSPEGFYTIAPAQMNPASSYHLSFNLGYPNAFDRAHGRTGSYLMVHGSCASIGCYAMTNPVIEDIWTLMIAAFDNRQSRVPVHIFPFEMTDETMAAHADHEWIEFWQELKPVWDAFEETKTPPEIRVSNKAYRLASGS